MNDKCELCNLSFTEEESNLYICQEFFKNDEFAVVYLFEEKLFIAIPLEYIDPRTRKHNELRKAMRDQLFKASYEFYASLEFDTHWGCPDQDNVELAGVKNPPCRLCAVSHKTSHGGCAHGDFHQKKRVILKNEETLQRLKKIGVIE